MHKENKIGFGSKEMLSVLDRLFNQGCDLLWDCTPSKFQGRVSEICGLFLSLCETGKGISILGKQGLLVNESYMLARGFFEKAVNVFYLLICEDEDFDSFFEYSLQKSFESQTRIWLSDLNSQNILNRRTLICQIIQS